MEFRIFIVCLCAFVVAAQKPLEEKVPIPCVNDEMCEKILEPGQKPRCSGNICLCLNRDRHAWDYCSMNDVIVGDKPKFINRPCHNDTECAEVKNMRCFSSTVNGTTISKCDCDAHLVMSANSTECLKIAHGPMSECTEIKQCVAGLGEFALCEANKCRCRDDYHFAEKKNACVANSGYGAKCTREEENCYQANEDGTKNVMGCARNNVCKCIRSYTYNNGMCQRSGASRIVPYLLILAVFAVAVINFKM